MNAGILAIRKTVTGTDMIAVEPEYFSAKSLAARVGISERTLDSHLKQNVGGILEAREFHPGLKGARFRSAKCRKYINLVTA